MEAQPRKPSWVSLVYFYLAALIGLVIVLTGVLIAVNSTVDAIFYQPPASSGTEFSYFASDRGDHLRTALQGLLTAGVGAPIFWWHLKQARRHEGFGDDR